MALSQDQVGLLLAPLSRDLVKSRKQGGRDVSYIEGWKAIEEANRIFGFDGWTRETVEIKCVSEAERTIGQQGTKGFGVTYIVKVRVMVGNVCREGCGAGHGIDRDLGQAHESAIKEAETDAMKRALMTFGNPFGLALYDKTQANVVDDAAPPAKRQNPHVTRAADILPTIAHDKDGKPLANIPDPDPSAIVKTRVVDQRPKFAELQKEIHAAATLDELAEWAIANKNRTGELSESWRDMLRGVYAEHQIAIRQLEIGDDERLAS